LRRCYQNGRDVRDYFYELNRYWCALGEITPREQRIRFWEGLDGWLERALIEDDYDPDVNSLEELYARTQTLQRACVNTEAKRLRETKHRGGGSGGDPNKKNSNNDN
ncbi:hypothetical protein FISHEDRAFT_23102, partial [Fistulina hepatica ATCC 64428]